MLGSQAMPFAIPARWSGGNPMFACDQLSACATWSGYVEAVRI